MKYYQDLKAISSQFQSNIEKLISTNSYSIKILIDALEKLESSDKNFVVDNLSFVPFEGSSLTAERIFKDQSFEEIKKFIDYLISIEYFNTDDQRDFVRNRIFSIIPPKQRKELSLYYFNNETSIIYRVGKLLAESNEGVDELVAIIEDHKKKNLHVKAAVAICENLIPSILDSSAINEYYPKNSTSSSNIPNVLKKLVLYPDEKISYLAIKTLFYSSNISLDEVELALKSSNQKKLFLALASFHHFRINVKDCLHIFPAVVELLEDKSIKVSEAANNTIQYFSRECPDEIAECIIELLVIRTTNRPPEYFNVGVTSNALKETFKYNPRLQSQMLHKCREVAFQWTGNTRSRAVFIGISISKKEFLSLVNEQKEIDPKTASSIASIVSGNLESSKIVKEISETDPKDIQQNAANQLNLLTSYYENGLSQAKLSFNWAVGITILCILSFLLIVFIFGKGEDKTIMWASALASGATEIIAGILLAIYRQTLSQLNNYNQQMSKIQNYLLANSFIESLNDSAKDGARLELIRSVTIGQTYLNSSQQKDIV